MPKASGCHRSQVTFSAYFTEEYHSFTSAVISLPPSLLKSSTKVSNSSMEASPIMILVYTSSLMVSSVESFSVMVSVGAPTNLLIMMRLSSLMALIDE